MDKFQAKNALDNLIKISRVHLYKPIQIAEILYHKRLNPAMNLLDKDSYRTVSKKWRDDISVELLGRKCTSSAKYQDDLFNDTAIPPEALDVLGYENNISGGAVEAYIYNQFDNRRGQLSDALNYCLVSTKENFDVKRFIESFRNESGLKRSLDKIYEIIVYSLFATIVGELHITVNVSMNEDKIDVVKEFEDFTKNVLCIDFLQHTYSQQARLFRVGSTNAADRGIDMYSNWGPVVQIKHLALDVELAENIADSISSDKIIIVCKTVEKNLILSLLSQLGWRSKIQSIITEDDLVAWYEKALRGNYSDQMGTVLLYTLIDEITEEFPSVDSLENILTARHYDRIKNVFWN